MIWGRTVNPLRAFVANIRQRLCGGQPGPKKSPRARLRCERLEDRDCPAVNLIANASVETPSTTASLPAGWHTDHYGTNAETFTYPTTGLDGQRSLRVDMTSRSDGDAKWYFDDVPVMPGAKYTFSDLYQSNAQTSATIRYKMSDGSYSYIGYYVAPAATSPTKFTFDFTAQSGAVSATVFHLIQTTGYLVTDAFSLTAAGSTGDTTAPTVSISSPVSGATLSGTVTLAAQASDNVGVAGVRFLVDGKQIGGEVASAPYQITLSTTTLSNGSHSVAGVARDAAGNSTTSASITFTVLNADTVAPTVSVSGPAANATVSGTINLSAQASDNLGVAGVRFLIDGQSFGNEVISAPYQVALDTTMLANGGHTVAATARDAAGNASTSSAVTFTVANTIQMPTNLIANPSVETLGTNGDPTGWSRDDWGTNATTFTPAVAGFDGARAVRVEMTSYASGDAKWVFNDVSVAPNTTYTFSDVYHANEGSELVARYKLSNGSDSYIWVANLGSQANWTAASYQVTTPANVVSMTMFHLIQGVGWLETDKFSLVGPGSSGGGGGGSGGGMVTLAFDDGWLSQLQNAVPVLEQAHLPASFYIITHANMGGSSFEEVQNPSLETAGTNGIPLDWSKSQTGTNSASFTYANTGSNGVHSARIDVSSYSSGSDAWYFQDVSVTSGTTYTVSHQFNATVPTSVVARFTNHDGSFTYVNLGGTQAATNGQWLTQTATVTAPANADAMTILHSISGVGSLSVDNFSVKELNPYADPTYMSPSQVQSLAAAGFEVGDHTMTHPYLTQLSAAGARAQIDGARADLIALGITPKTLAYPYGAYNSSIESIVSGDGFIGARTVNDGTNTSTTDHFALFHHEVDVTTTLADVQSWISTAKATHTWLILTFHRVDYSGDTYSTTPDEFQQIVNLVASSNLAPVTMAGGIARL
jgi:peptidoglycan/xylan/chitin deacetylase (PgdA/CDA1 family)